jgi:hypothetical protein
LKEALTSLWSEVDVNVVTVRAIYEKLEAKLGVTLSDRKRALVRKQIDLRLGNPTS